jgi:hypothetical protein
MLVIFMAIDPAVLQPLGDFGPEADFAPTPKGRTTLNLPLVEKQKTGKLRGGGTSR